MIELFGIKNCDTVKKARRWLDDQGIAYEFIDLRDTPVDAPKLQEWIAQQGEALVNKRSTTWRQLAPEDKTELDDDKILALITEHPTLIKRPVLKKDHQITLGFKADAYQHLLID